MAVKGSADLLHRTWGENLIGNVGLGLVFGVAHVGLAIVAVGLLVLAAQTGNAIVISTVTLLGVLAFFTLAALHSTMQGVYSAALYRFATDHATPLPGFGPALLEERLRREAVTSASVSRRVPRGHPCAIPMPGRRVPLRRRSRFRRACRRAILRAEVRAHATG
ncbi:MAG: DUF6159 family protein [Comamonadaceae bacterium]|nr:DUF6159 family protein [Comamonadaceae bacterium]